MSTTDDAAAMDALVEQAAELCDIHDHITRVIANLDVSQDTFSDQYSHSSTTDFVFESVVRMFLYQHARGFNDSELYRRLTGAAYVWIRFQLERPPTQQAINYMWRRRLSLTDRRTIMATAREIRAVAATHDIIADGEPRLDPDEVDDASITDEQIMQAIRVARDRGLAAFDTDRAAVRLYNQDDGFRLGVWDNEKRQAYIQERVNGDSGDHLSNLDKLQFLRYRYEKGQAVQNYVEKWDVDDDLRELAGRLANVTDDDTYTRVLGDRDITSF